MFYNYALFLSPQPLDTVPVGYPSLLGHFTSLALNHPIYSHIVTMAERQEQPSLVGDVSLILKGLPCDVHLLNLRYGI